MQTYSVTYVNSSSEDASAIADSVNVPARNSGTNIDPSALQMRLDNVASPDVQQLYGLGVVADDMNLSD